MKILSAEQIREADAATLAEQNIYSHDLMERAAVVFYNWFKKNIPVFEKYSIVCGTGNNGGDGLCIARMLHADGFDVTVFITGDPDNASPDFKLNYTRLTKTGLQRIIPVNDSNTDQIADGDCIIDALFGSGLNRAPEGIFAQVITAMNNSGAFIISVDMPSGLFADRPTDGICTEADITFSFELPKLSFFFPENEKYTGQFIVRSIGLSSHYLQNAESRYTLITDKMIADCIRPRTTFSHKGSYGHALIIAGKPGMGGAANLCGLACLTAGAGRTTISNVDSETEFAELMSAPRDAIISHIKNDTFNAVAIGPGIGTDKIMTDLLFELLPAIQFPVVLDADALNILADNPALLQSVPAGSILTPHPKEFERLFGKYNTWDQLLSTLRKNGKKLNCYIVYKRAYTILCTPEEKMYFNSTGNAGMATAGSGDVLTGIITALLAQHYTPEEAACTGIFLHGLAGDIAHYETSGQNIITGDIIANVQKAFDILMQEEE